MTRVWLYMAMVSLAGCTWDLDYSQKDYRCADLGVCPDGYSCGSDGYCHSSGDVCAGVNCGSGTCETFSSNAYCDCYINYHPVGLSCAANVSGDECNGITCDNHGSCMLSGSDPFCSCDMDYTAVGLHCFAPECESFDCSSKPNSRCESMEGTPTCVCNEGYTDQGGNCVQTAVARTALLMHFESDTTTISCGNHTATTDSSPTIETSNVMFGNGALNTSGGTVAVLDSPDWAFGQGAFVLEAWVNPTYSASTGPYGAIFSQGSSMNDYWELAVQIGEAEDFYFTFEVMQGSNPVYTLSSQTSTSSFGTYHHVAVVCDGSDTYLFVDGMLVDIHTAGAIQDLNTPLNIGLSVGGQRFLGFIDEARISVDTDRGWVASSFATPTESYSDCN